VAWRVNHGLHELRVCDQGEGPASRRQRVKKRSESVRFTVSIDRPEPLSRDFGRRDIQKLMEVGDWDRPRLHCLGDFAHEVDV